jgi:hypothetical protein
MAAVSTAIALGSLAVGGATAIKGSIDKQEASKAAARASQEYSAASQRAESLRRTQMELDAARKRRDIIRQTIVARSTATSNANYSGSLYGSGLQGGLSQISQEGNSQLVSLGQNLAIGRGIFDANADASAAQYAGNIAQSNAQSANSMFNLGIGLMQNAGTIGRVGGSIVNGKPEDILQNI